MVHHFTRIQVLNAHWACYMLSGTLTNKSLLLTRGKKEREKGPSVCCSWCVNVAHIAIAPSLHEDALPSVWHLGKSVVNHKKLSLVRQCKQLTRTRPVREIRGISCYFSWKLRWHLTCIIFRIGLNRICDVTFHSVDSDRDGKSEEANQGLKVNKRNGGNVCNVKPSHKKSWNPRKDTATFLLQSVWKSCVFLVSLRLYRLQYVTVSVWAKGENKNMGVVAHIIKKKKGEKPVESHPRGITRLERNSLWCCTLKGNTKQYTRVRGFFLYPPSCQKDFFSFLFFYSLNLYLFPLVIL